MEHVRNM